LLDSRLDSAVYQERRHYSLLLPFDSWSGLWCVELAPASRTDVALDEFAGVRWLEIDAIVAVLLSFWLLLILGVSLADFLLCRGPRHRGHGRGTERKFRKHSAARYPLGIVTVVAHVRIPSVLMYGVDTSHQPSMIAINRRLFPAQQGGGVSAENRTQPAGERSSEWTRRGRSIIPWPSDKRRNTSAAIDRDEELCR
jgi:hypothetical protein